MKEIKSKFTLYQSNKELIQEWHPTKNEDLTPKDVFHKSHERVWWKCKNCSHEWQAVISSRSNGSGCPNCREIQRKKTLIDNKIIKYGSLSDSHPELALEWNYKKNIGLTPLQVHYGSSNSVWWNCKIGHEWEAKITDRVRGNSCPFCSGRYATENKNLLTYNPSLAIEWDFDKNFRLVPSDVTPTSHKLVWWKCRKGIHSSFQATVNARSKNTGCPYCSGKRVCNENSLFSLNPILADEWDYEKNGNFTPNDVVLHSGKKVWWKCNNGHPSWEAVINSRVEGRGCPKCAKELKTSFPEQAIFFYINKHFKNTQNGFYYNYNDRQQEIDIFIPEYNIGIEYDGQRYHSAQSQVIKDEQKNEIVPLLVEIH